MKVMEKKENRIFGYFASQSPVPPENREVKATGTEQSMLGQLLEDLRRP